MNWDQAAKYALKVGGQDAVDQAMREKDLGGWGGMWAREVLRLANAHGYNTN
jgi:hypothetical protein